MSDKIKILLVDDDEDDFIITQDIIDDIPGAQYHLDWTASFNEALKLIDEKKHNIYLVDYRLGAHDGLELITKAIETVARPLYFTYRPKRPRNR